MPAIDPRDALRDPLALSAAGAAPAGSDLLELSEEQAVRRSFDARNRRVLPWVLWPFAAFFFGTTIGKLEAGDGGWELGVLGLLLTAGVAVALRLLLPVGARRRGPQHLASAIARRFGELLVVDLVLVFLLAGALAATAEGDNPQFLFISALLLLLFRLPLLALVGAHLVAFVSGAALLWVSDFPVLLEVSLGASVLHLVAALLGWWLARRHRGRFLAGFQQAVAQAREQLRLREELALARAVQLSMLPEAMPQLPWLDVAAVCLPAAEVGGDYYDFFPEPDALGVAVADVAGHGIASGLVLATVRSGLALLMEEPGGERTLERLDRLVRRGRRRMLVTLCLARFDAAARTVTVTTAGHPALLLRRADGSVAEIGAPAPPLGTRLPAVWPPSTAPFSPGDVFVLYSDGLVETADREGEGYGLGRLHELLAACDPALGAAALCGQVVAAVDRHRADASQEDDLTAVVLVAR
jgi:hypothetical protein